jgi:hypothetical protein
MSISVKKLNNYLISILDYRFIIDYNILCKEKKGGVL